MIDLHLHTTASDGLLPPSALAESAHAAGLTVISVTDHDTVAGLADARAAAEARGMQFVDGIEITAVDRGRDVHILGYFFDPSDAAFAAFLQAQRADRLSRVREIVDRLHTLGLDIDPSALARAAAAYPGRSLGRPQIADALVAAGHAADRTDAFDRLIGQGRPGFVARRGPSPETVIAALGAAGGIASLAHPVLLDDDALVERLAGAGLTALEVRHSEHDARAEAHYRRVAGRFGLLVTGGSDFHGPGAHHRRALGDVTLPAADFARLRGGRS